MDLSCNEISGSDCDYVAEGKTMAETEGKLIHHGLQEHAEMMKGMDEGDSVSMMEKMHEKLAARA